MRCVVLGQGCRYKIKKKKLLIYIMPVDYFCIRLTVTFALTLNPVSVLDLRRLLFIIIINNYCT